MEKVLTTSETASPSLPTFHDFSCIQDSRLYLSETNQDSRLSSVSHATQASRLSVSHAKQDPRLISSFQDLRSSVKDQDSLDSTRVSRTAKRTKRKINQSTQKAPTENPAKILTEKATNK